MALVRPTQDLEPTNLTERFYRGVVIDNNDPKKLHRVKIRIQEIHGSASDIPDSNLPWAIQFRPTFLGGNTDLSLGAIPRVGSDIIVTHIRGEIYQPAYVFELAHANNKTAKTEEDYPNSYLLQDSDGNFWHVNMNSNQLNIKFNGKEVLEITETRDSTVGQDDIKHVGNDETTTINKDQTLDVMGKQTVTVAGDRTDSVGGDTNFDTTNFTVTTSANCTINCSGNITVTANGTCDITASSINLNGSSAGVLTQESINELTGNPFIDGSTTVKAGQG